MHLVSCAARALEQRIAIRGACKGSMHVKACSGSAEHCLELHGCEWLVTPCRRRRSPATALCTSTHTDRPFTHWHVSIYTATAYRCSPACRLLNVGGTTCGAQHLGRQPLIALDVRTELSLRCYGHDMISTSVVRDAWCAGRPASRAQGTRPCERWACHVARPAPRIAHPVGPGLHCRQITTGVRRECSDLL